MHPISVHGWVLLKGGDGWSPRWMAIDNGLVIWYHNELQIKPAGLAFVIGNYQTLHQVLPSGEEIVSFTIQNASGRETLEMGVTKDESIIWSIAIENHAKFTLTRPIAAKDLTEIDGLLQFDNDDADKKSTSAEVEIQLKNNRRSSIKILPKDDVPAIASELVKNNDLNPAVQPKIELVLLRAQVEIFHAIEERLRKQITYMKRRVTDTVFAEQRALAAENHAATLASSLERIQNLMVDVKQRISQLHEENKLNDEVIENLKLQLTQTTHKAQKRIDAILENQDAAYISASESRSNSPFRSPDSNAGKNEEAKSIASYIAQIKDVRRQKARLHTQVAKFEAENKWLKIELRTLSSHNGANRRNKAVYLDDETEGSDHSKMISLEEKVLSLKNKLHNAEVTGVILQKRCEGFTVNLKASTKALKQAEDDLLKCRQQLKLTIESSASHIVDGLYAENNVLREQAMKMRSEILRLQGELNEVSNSAIVTVQSILSNVQHDNPEVNKVIELLQNNKLSNDTALYEASPLQECKDDDEVSFRSENNNSNNNESMDSTRRSPSVNSSPTAILRSLVSSDSGQKLSSHEDHVNPFLLGDLSNFVLSNVVENRLLRAIYGRYVFDAAGNGMNLMKFGRFAREFGLVGVESNQIVAGVVDIIFDKAYKIIPEGEEVLPAPPRAFGVRAGAENASKTVVRALLVKGTHQHKGGLAAAHVISPGQFIWGVKEIACKIYASLIEEQLGAPLECLPKKQKIAAEKTVMEIMIKKKILPVATNLGLSPFSLIYLEQSLHMMYENNLALASLEQHSELMNNLFEHYSSSMIIASPIKNGEDNTGLLGKIMSYKALSRFAHDFSIIPYLLKEPIFHKSFREISLWMRADSSILNRTLPIDILDIPDTIRDKVLSADVLSNTAHTALVNEKKQYLNLQGFKILLVATAIQSFSDQVPYRRITSIFDWIAQSGGMTLVKS